MRHKKAGLPLDRFLRYLVKLSTNELQDLEYLTKLRWVFKKTWHCYRWYRLGKAIILAQGGRNSYFQPKAFFKTKPILLLQHFSKFSAGKISGGQIIVLPKSIDSKGANYLKIKHNSWK